MTSALQVETRWGARTLDVCLLESDTLTVPEARDVTVLGAQRLGREALKEAGRLVDGALTLAPGEVAWVREGPLTSRYRLVERPAPAPSAPEPDTTFNKIAAIAFLFAIAGAAMCQVTFLGQGGEGDALRYDAASFRKWLVHPETPKAIRAPKIADKLPPSTTTPRDAKPKDATPPTDKRAADQAKVAGLLDGLFGGNAKDSVFKGGGLGVGINQALDGLHADGPLAAEGLAGLGVRGLPGGGGPGPGLGLGGPGVGAWRGPRRPGGGFDVGAGRHLSVAPCGAACGERISDGLPRDVVARVIARHFSEVKFCYEQQLQKSQALAGKVAVMFVIDGTGSVQEASVAESTMDNASVEACIVARVRRWKFPEPAGGGVVSVTYPWVFKPAGSDD